ncbi:uncharacterized protein L201_007882 [Kwoniella dendrophila CBS 6074]|uniref:Uncharacterized protein n=1 Tax=Kwoniella dendrophila CBS 6074 TaxID=1295534 RepID=A0AAX4K6Z6_9TREE
MPYAKVQRPATGPRSNTTGQPQHMSSGQSSVYLSPVQEARIDSWRKGASEATSPTIKQKPKTVKSHKSKSAPASIGHSSSSKGSCTCTCTQCEGYQCPTCGGELTNDCSCSIHSPKSRTSQKSKKSGSNIIHGYYSSGRKRQLSIKHNTRPEPPLPVTEETPINFAVLKAPDKLDLPNINQVREHQYNVLPPVQWPPAPGQEYPIREMAKPAMEPPLPRIGGVRDPISTNYYRNMFPPHGNMKSMMIPGLHPIGMVPAKPWNP